jgi:hypothetical protein
MELNRKKKPPISIFHLKFFFSFLGTIGDDSGLLLQTIQVLNQESNPKQPYHHTTTNTLTTYLELP